MSSRYPPYANYRSSGVDWLGDVPCDWRLLKLAHAYPEMGSGTTPPSDSAGWYGGPVPWITTGELREREVLATSKTVTLEALKQFSALRVFPKGSVAIAMYGATIGRLGILGVEATTNQACCVLPISEVLDNEYLYFWFQAVRDDIINLASGGGQPNISQAVVGSLRVSAPPLEEQCQIARFLDYETAKIDALIEKQQQLIALLKEKRQAVISHAVTKGLDPQAKLKDSGVEWLGKVPAHWEVLKGSWLGQLFGSESVPEDHVREEGTLIFIKVSSLARDGFELAERQFYVSDAYATAVTARAGFVVFPKRGAAIFTNKVNIVHEPAVIDPNLMGWIPNGRAMPEFLAHLLKLRGLDDIADVSTVPQINNKHIAPMMFPVPSMEEQCLILWHLNERLSILDDLMARSEEQVELLQERRTALISAAVTGKIDVRAWQPPEGAATQQIA